MNTPHPTENDQTTELETKRILSEIARNEEQALTSKLEREQLLKKISLPWYRRTDVIRTIGSTIIVGAVAALYVLALLTAAIRHDNELLRSDVKRLQDEVAAMESKNTAAMDGRFKELNNRVTSLEQARQKDKRAESLLPPKFDPVVMQDYMIEQERKAIIADLSLLASKAQQYYATSTSLGGGGRSFIGLTADASGLTLLASARFTNNANGTYTIKTAGNAYRIVFHGVGKIALLNGTFPAYDMAVTSTTQVPTRLN